MKRSIAVSLVFIFILILPELNLHAENRLYVRSRANSQQKQGYINNAVVVTEPHGAYTEHTVYVEYTDNLAFPGFRELEIVHKFELPEGAIVHDLWLWVGTNVMKGLILDTWTARTKYDSIVSFRVDPAILFQGGDQFELRIYPLISGQSRRIKMSYIVPTKWEGASGSAELPFKYLNASGGATLPVDVMFKTTQDAYRYPLLKEQITTPFYFAADTLGYIYQKCRVPNLKSLSSLRIIYNTNYAGGAYFTNNYLKKTGNFYQYSFIPWKMMQADTMSRPPQKVIIGVDLSGDFSKHYPVLMPKLKLVLKSALKTGDSFKLLIAGAGRMKYLQENWISYQSSTIDAVLDSFVNSPYGDSVSARQRPKVIFADGKSTQIWSYPGLETQADTQRFFRLESTIPYITQSYITAAYEHGYESILNDWAALDIRQRLDSLFLQGGRFLTYYDRNRIGREKIAKHYIPSLGIKSNTNNTITLFRAVGGNISDGFPLSHVRKGAYFLSYNDTTVYKELVDGSGNPCVISKKLGNGGLLIVSGVWSFNDSLEIKKLMSSALLGIMSSTGQKDFMLKNMLLELRNKAVQEPGSMMMVFTNSDSLVNLQGTEQWVNEYWAPLAGKRIKFRSINLLDGADAVPVYYPYDGTYYYGSGYLMKVIADKSFGAHFETHVTPWQEAANLLIPTTYPLVDSMTVNFTFLNTQDSLLSKRKVKIQLLNPHQPVTFIGEMKASSQITAQVSVRFEGMANTYNKNITYGVSNDTTSGLSTVSSMYGNERLIEKMYNSPWDTSGVIKMALNHNLVTFYTSLLCLEPNDTIHPLINPLDETGLVPVELAAFRVAQDSIGMLIEWSVVSEHNNRGFRIERITAKTMLPVAFVPGRGTSLSPYTYVLRDDKIDIYNPEPITYRLYQVDYDGTERLIAESRIIPAEAPLEYSLEQNYPNPFNPSTNIAYSVKERGSVNLTLHDILGNKVAEVVNEVKDRGRYIATFDGKALSSGVYFYTLRVNGFTQTKKLTLLK